MMTAIQLLKVRVGEALIGLMMSGQVDLPPVPIYKGPLTRASP
jgi:hypothetical protein